MTPQELAELDLAVAKALGAIEPYRAGEGPDKVMDRQQPGFMIPLPTSRAFALELLERFYLRVEPDSGGWLCWDNKRMFARGPTPAIAICRAVVALKETR